MSKITMIPAGKEIRLSQEIYYYMLMQVPQGRLTRDCDIREYLNELYGASYIDFDILATLRTLPGYEKHMVYYSCLPDDIAVWLWKQGARNNEKSQNGVYPGRGLRKTGVSVLWRMP